MIQSKADLMVLLNAKPKPEWVKTHPFVRNLKYIPIEVVEFLLRSIFINWYVEIKEVKMLANSVLTTVRVHVEAANGNETYTMWQDGVGASPIQISKRGTGAIDFDNMQTGAIMMAAPAAESFAIKDAAEKFGRIFGSDLNRKAQSDYSFLKQRANMITEAQPVKSSMIDAAKTEILGCNTRKEVSAIYDKHTKLQSNEEFATAIKERLKELGQLKIQTTETTEKQPTEQQTELFKTEA